MRGRLTAFALGALAALALAAPAQAQTTSFSDVPPGFWARGPVLWSVNHGWIAPRSATKFGPAHTASRQTAARVLAYVAKAELGAAVPADPYAQALAKHWIAAGSGPSEAITQREFDRGVVRALGLRSTAAALDTLRTADGWKPPLPAGFGVEQVIRALGGRVNAPDGSDAWEEWPNDPLRRADLAVQAYALAHMDSWAPAFAQGKTAVLHALPTWTPLKRKVLGFALRYAGAPYVWGGEYPTPSSPYGAQAAGGFDCSGFVWWVMKMHTYTAGRVTWSGDSKILGRDTYTMARDLPASRRIPRAGLHPGDILFWSSAPNGVRTAWSTVYHAGIYLGNGWTINSHGSGDGVTLDYMGSGAGWYHDAFAFGWRVMPLGK
jgi:cell wall-associated NlpC family hydrolase